MMLSEVMPSLSAAKFTTRRWRSTGLAKCANIFKRDMRAAVDQGAGFGAEDQELRRPRAGAQANWSRAKSGAPSSRTRVCRTRASV